MSLCELPNEMIRKIAMHLDQDSLVSLACVDQRFRDVIAGFLEPLKSDVLNDHLLTYLTSSGSNVRSLDLSNCQVSSAQLEYVVICNRGLEELHLLNTSLTFPALWGVLPMLENLQRISFSVLSTSEYDAFSFTQAAEGLVFPSIKEIDVEVTPCYWTMDLLIDILNRCESIERIHVNVIGFYQEIRQKCLFGMQASRWRTLKTVVITDTLAGYSLYTDVLIARIFGRDHQSRGLAWAFSKRESFIYHDGWMNCQPEANQTIAPNADWLKTFARINIALLDDFEDFRKLSCDEPRSLRLCCPRRTVANKITLAIEIIQWWSCSLVELYLADCHGFVSMRHRLTLFSALKSIETLVTSGCLIGLTLRDDEDEPIECLTLEDRQAFANVFRKMKLKKLIIIGNNYSPTCMRTFFTLPRLEDLRNLEELSLSSLTLSKSTYIYLAHSTVRTIRLQVDWQDNFKVFQRFLQHCPNVENLSLLSASHRLDRPEVWDGLNECRKLKRLCLRSDQRPDLFVPQMQRALGQILFRLEVLHLHVFCFADPGSAPCLEDIRGLEIFRGFKGLYVGATLNPLSQAVPCRSLCQIATFIGQAKPKNWD